MTADFDDFDHGPPRARRTRAKTASAPGTRGKPPGRSQGRRAWEIVRRYPLEAGIVIALSGAVGAVAYNALLLQTSRHPAPFFGQGGRTDGPAPLPPARPFVTAPAPTAPALAGPPAPARPAARETIGDLIRGGDIAPQVARAVPARPTAVSPAQTAAAPPPVAVRDPIGDLIRLGGGAPPTPPALVGRPDPTRTIAAGQRALAKLGYGSMKTDGLLGPETRQAIERFERDRHLPVTGEFSGRTARELSVLSGIPVE
jgi:hypothetical protein